MTFEEYLQEEFSRQEPCILDDDIPDAFGDWIANLGADEWIDIGEGFRKEYGKKIITEIGDDMGWEESTEYYIDKLINKYEESFDKQMGNPIEQLNNLTK